MSLPMCFDTSNALNGLGAPAEGQGASILENTNSLMCVQLDLQADRQVRFAHSHLAG